MHKNTPYDQIWPHGAKGISHSGFSCEPFAFSDLATVPVLDLELMLHSDSRLQMILGGLDRGVAARNIPDMSHDDLRIVVGLDLKSHGSHPEFNRRIYREYLQKQSGLLGASRKGDLIRKFNLNAKHYILPK